ncbi:hypothetical protein QN239_19185 [Mycolicibacterium sp. Y3]
MSDGSQLRWTDVPSDENQTLLIDKPHGWYLNITFRQRADAPGERVYLTGIVNAGPGTDGKWCAVSADADGQLRTLASGFASEADAAERAEQWERDRS